VILTGFGVFGLFGVVFALPQGVTAVMGLDAQGSGFRLLPLIGGLIVGAVPADRIAARLGAKITVTTGFTLLLAALAVAFVVPPG
jgi:DHA2 family multidrug resistance protein-like MFS transporter